MTILGGSSMNSKRSVRVEFPSGMAEERAEEPVAERGEPDSEHQGDEAGVEGLDDIVEEFLVESHENLDQLDQDLVALEQDPRSRDRLSSIFRTIHTIKGTSGFLAFNRLAEVAHVRENMLSRLRDGALELNP